MARELPIHNGRLTTDLNADGHLILNLRGGTLQVQSDWSQTDATAPDFIKNKPTIPADVTVDATLATEGAAADAKAVGDALRGGFTKWVCEPPTYNGRDVEVKPFSSQLFVNYWRLQYVSDGEVLASIIQGPNEDLLELDFEDVGVTATRRLITPTKTSQLTNNSGFLTSHQDVSGKADKVSGATEGNFAVLNAQGNLTDSGAKPSDFATPSDLPYAMVEPGKWEFSADGFSDVQKLDFVWYDHGDEDYRWDLFYNGTNTYVSYSVDPTTMEITGTLPTDVDSNQTAFTATRTSLPGHLFDRAGNRVVVTGRTTLTLPAANPGYLRDFLVRLEISGSTVPTITFAAPTGETKTIVYETDGDEFPVPDETGTWLYSFTETAAHKFAVSLKKVNEVAQGGS